MRPSLIITSSLFHHIQFSPDPYITHVVCSFLAQCYGFSHFSLSLPPVARSPNSPATSLANERKFEQQPVLRKRRSGILLASVAVHCIFVSSLSACQSHRCPADRFASHSHQLRRVAECSPTLAHCDLVYRRHCHHISLVVSCRSACVGSVLSKGIVGAQTEDRRGCSSGCQGS